MAFDGAVEARAFEVNDEPRVLELLQAAFGRWPRSLDGAAPSEFFRWKHMAGPFGPSVLLVAILDGAVIGFVAYMPWQFSAGGRTLLAMRGVDLAVHPSHRRLGVSMALRAAARFSSDVAFIWTNPNEHSQAGSLKAGRRESRPLPRFARPHGRLRQTVGRARARGSKTPGRLPVEADAAAEVLRDGAHASLLLARTEQPGERLATVKDLDYLRWRYGNFDEYRAVRTDASTGGGGLAIFRPRRHGSLWVSDVCELFVERGDRPTARRLLREVGAATAADFITCGFSSRRDAAHHGFVRSGRGAIVSTVALQQNLVPDPTRPASWALSRGDLDLL